MGLNEADTRAQLIDPTINVAGLTRSQVTREHYYRPDWEYTAGRIILRGDRAERLPPRRVDYLLRYTDSFPIAVVEAKEEGKPAVSGLEQAKQYARELGLAFGYTTNGHEIIEWDVFTNSTRIVEKFPTPDDLWKRWIINTNLGIPSSAAPRQGGPSEIRPLYDPKAAAARRRNPLLHPYASPDLTRGKTPRYFQEVAIKESILRMMRGQKRMLLTMATGTGKTFVAFQIVWKLVKSGWLHHREVEQPARILFLADRVVLRDQAYNAFSAFANSQSDPRFLLDGQKKLSLNRDLYFAIYQSLWGEEKGKHIFEHFPKDFFDLVIIDEAHRSGFGTWKEILDYFDQAIQLGMTATPKQEENIDTYAYFCQEEPVIAVDPGDPGKGVVHPPAYSYSLGQGIEDGFLATYKIHRIYTNIDKAGLQIREAIERGAEVFVPEDVDLKPAYYTPQFEREIRLPERTEAMVGHLAQLLRRFSPLHKTMVFCVDISHAQEVARLLNNAFSDLGYGEDYAVPIVSEEGEQGRRWLNQFQDSDRKLPVVATTAELLSTGVDVPSVRNIVFMKTLSSPILFKQIIGRGSRVDPDTGKLWFRIIDYTGATRLLDPRWDRPPSPQGESVPEKPQNAALKGCVRLADSGELLVGASVAVIAAPNDQRGPILTDPNGRYSFDGLPAAEVLVVASGPGLARRQLHVGLEENINTTFDIELKPASERQGMIQVRGLQVTIAEEATFIVAGAENPMTLEAYIDYTRQEITHWYPEWEDFATAWKDPFQRQEVVKQLDKVSVRADVLAEVLEEPEVDEFDLLAHLAYGRALRTRRERARDFQQQEVEWLNAFPNPAQEVILALLRKYEVGGLRQITDPNIFRVSPFHEMGELRGVVQRFDGDAKRLRSTIDEIQMRLYAA